MGPKVRAACAVRRADGQAGRDRLDRRHAGARCAARPGRWSRSTRPGSRLVAPPLGRRARHGHDTGSPDRRPRARSRIVAWYALSPRRRSPRRSASTRARGLDRGRGRARLEQYGPNRFAEAQPEPRWRAFVRQYRDPMQIVLLVAGIGSLYPLKELGTGLVLLFLTLFNAVLGLHQEGKAAEAVAALQKMMIVKARVRRGGELLSSPAEELVPGDVVSIEAGDLVPADGRLLQAATLEVDESALTGESMPVSKGVEARRRRRHAARRPHRHGLHEHERHPRRRRVRRHRDRDGDRGRPHLGHARGAGRGRDAAHEAAREADDADPRRSRASRCCISVSSTCRAARRSTTVFVAAIAFAVAAIPTGLPAVVTDDPLAAARASSRRRTRS